MATTSTTRARSRSRSRARPAAGADLDRSLQIAGIAVVAAAFLGMALVTRTIFDAFQAPKATAVWACAAVTVGALSVHALRRGRIPALDRRTLVIFLAVPAALVLSLLVADNVLLSFFGLGFRHAAILQYLSLGLLGLAVVALGAADPRIPRRVVVALTLACAATGVYATIQSLGLDPYEWTGTTREAIGLVGNTNYAGALSASAAAPLAIAVAHRSVSLRWRVIAGALLLAAAWATFATGTSQGPALLLVAPLVSLLTWLWSRDDEWRERGPRIVAGVAVLGAFLVALGIAQQGPISFLGEDRNVENRRIYWTGSVDLIQDNLLLGVGPDQFGDHYRLYRDEREAFREASEDAANAPHSVPLEMFSNAGIPGIAAHVAMVLLVGLMLFRALSRVTDPTHRWWLAAAGSLWFSYQVQSTISIDVPPLSALHWLSAGAVVALALPVLRDGEEATAASTATKGSSRSGFGRIAPSNGVRVAFAGVGLVLSLGLLAATWVQVSGMRLLHRGVALANGGDLEAGEVEFIRSAERMPWSLQPRLLAGEVALASGDPRGAIEHLDQAREIAPFRIQPLFLLVNSYLRMNDLDAAIEVADEVIEIDQHLARGYIGRARLAMLDGDEERALELARIAVSKGNRDEAWFYLGQVLQDLGRLDEAREAYLTAAELGGEQTDDAVEVKLDELDAAEAQQAS